MPVIDDTLAKKLLEVLRQEEAELAEKLEEVRRQILSLSPDGDSSRKNQESGEDGAGVRLIRERLAADKKQRAPKGEAERLIRRYLKDSPEGAGFTAISKGLDIPLPTVYKALRRMKEKGEVKSENEKWYLK
jgi:sugar-specific transcriptional regulator TrmB